jgi:hypothetical protein
MINLTKESGERQATDGARGDLPLADLQTVAESIVGSIDWNDDGVTGFAECPGIDLHTTPDAPKDCRLKIDGIPTISCFHQHCTDEVEAANRKLRAGCRGRHPRAATRPSSSPTGEHSQTKNRSERRNAKADNGLAIQSIVALPQIITEFAIAPSKWLTMSPTHISEDPADHWRQLLGLYAAKDILWIGAEVWESSASDTRFKLNFRRVELWLAEEFCQGKFTCPAIFKTGVHSRSNANVARRPYLVVESDVLTKSEVGAVFSWMRQFLKLRAIVDTAGKSLHGWFDFPDEEPLGELKVILPALGCDAALFKTSQPCRLPGAMRNGKFQKLLFLDLEGVKQ